MIAWLRGFFLFVVTEYCCRFYRTVVPRLVPRGMRKHDFLRGIKFRLYFGAQMTVIVSVERWFYFANICERSAKALNSRAFPDGSRKNMVACSPISPSKRL